MTHWPPLYPVLLAAPSVFGIDILDGARWLNALFFGLNILLVGLVIRRCSRGSLWPAVVGSLWMLSSIPMLWIHCMAMTEPLFILLGLSGFVLLAEYMENPRRLILIAASVAFGLAFVTRYAGVSLVAAGIAGILLLGKKNFFRRIQDCFLFGAVSSFPMAIWIARNYMIANRATSRIIRFQPPCLTHLKEALATVSMWVFPAGVPGILRKTQTVLPMPGGSPWVALAAGLLVAGAAALWLRKAPNAPATFKECVAKIPPVIALLVVFSLVYAMFLWLAIILFDAAIPLDHRILAPAFVSSLIPVLWLAYEILPSGAAGVVTRAVSFPLLCGLSVMYVSYGVIWTITSHADGLGYAGKIWTQSEVIRHVRSLPRGTPVFSNGPDIVNTLTGMSASWIPIKVYRVSGKINKYYLSDFAAIKERMETDGAVVVYLNNVTWRWYLATEPELRKQLPLRVLVRAADGTIYTLDAATKEHAR